MDEHLRNCYQLPDSEAPDTIASQGLHPRPSL